MNNFVALLYLTKIFNNIFISHFVRYIYSKLSIEVDISEFLVVPVGRLTTEVG